MLGSGSYARVYASSIQRHGLEIPVAVKETLPESDGFVHASAIREISALCLMKKVTGVATPLNVHVSDDSCTVRVTLPRLHETLLDNRRGRAKLLPSSTCANITRTLVHALAHAHAHGLIHRDIKPENIMFASSSTDGSIPDRGVTLIDFGLARHSPTTRAVRSPYVVTRWYRAPEILLGFSNYGSPADMWALGVTIAEALIGSVLFPGRDQMHQLQLIFEKLGAPTLETWPTALRTLRKRGVTFRGPSPANAKRSAVDALSLQSVPPIAADFVVRCLVLDPCQRLTALQALEHPFVIAASSVPMARAMVSPARSRLDAMDEEQRTWRIHLSNIGGLWGSHPEARRQLLSWLVEAHGHLRLRSLALPVAFRLLHLRFVESVAPSPAETAGAIAMAALIVAALTYGNPHTNVDDASQLARCSSSTLRLAIARTVECAARNGGTMQPTYLHFIDAASESGGLFSAVMVVPSHDSKRIMPSNGPYVIARFFAEAAAVHKDATVQWLPSEHASASLVLGCIVELCLRSGVHDGDNHSGVGANDSTSSSPTALRAALAPVVELLNAPPKQCVETILSAAQYVCTHRRTHRVGMKYEQIGLDLERIHTKLEEASRRLNGWYLTLVRA